MPPQQLHLSEEDIEKIANRVYDKIYADLGKSIAKRIVWPLMIVATAMWVYLAGKWPLK